MCAAQHRAGSEGEEFVQEVRPGGVADAAPEGIAGRRDRGERGTQDAMIAQDCEQFSSEIGANEFEHAPPDDDMLRVRAWQDDQPVGEPVGGEADEDCLLAPHHLIVRADARDENALAGEHPRRDPSRRQRLGRQRERGAGVRQVPHPDRRGGHAREDQGGRRKVGPRSLREAIDARSEGTEVEPLAVSRRAGLLPGSEGRADPVVRLDLGQGREGVRLHEAEAEARGAPVSADEPGRPIEHHHSFVRSCDWRARRARSPGGKVGCHQSTTEPSKTS